MKLQDFNLFDVVEMDYYGETTKTERIVSLVVSVDEYETKFRDIVANELDEWTCDKNSINNIIVISVWNLKNKVLNELPELAI